MKKDKISRRDFLKVTLLGIGASFIAACKLLFKPITTVLPAFTATPSQTNTPLPTETNAPTATPTETQTPTPTEIPCFRLLAPENGVKLPAIGKVTFLWEDMQGATHYQIQFTLPNGQVVSFDVESISNTRYIESFLAGGLYTWQVIALDDNNVVICVAEPFKFEKPAYVPPQNNGGGNDGSGAVGGGAPGGGAPGGGTPGGGTPGG